VAVVRVAPCDSPSPLAHLKLFCEIASAGAFREHGVAGWTPARDAVGQLLGEGALPLLSALDRTRKRRAKRLGIDAHR
jgi:hypothetical protein